MNIIEPFKDIIGTNGNPQELINSIIAPFRLYVYELNMPLRVSKDTASSKISSVTPKKGSAIWSWRLAVGYTTFVYTRNYLTILLRQGYTVGTRRVARLMKEMNLFQGTTKSLQGERKVRMVWVSDITCLLDVSSMSAFMDVFTRMESALEPILTLKPLEEALCHSVPEFIIPIKACSIFQRLILPRSKNMALRFPSPNGTPLGEWICRKTHSHPQRGRS